MVLDAYCGIGTIGLTAADHAKQVVGVELNRDAVQDAIGNAKHNGVKNARFFAADATRWISEAAAAGERADVIFMDPPREGSTPQFIERGSYGPEAGGLRQLQTRKRWPVTSPC